MNQSSVLDRAKAHARLQGRLGNSPGEFSFSGAPVLCAAACVARAALGLRDEAMLLDFDRRVLAEDKFTYLPHVFEACGLDGEDAVALIKENDKRQGTERLAWFESLSGLGS